MTIYVGSYKSCATVTILYINCFCMCQYFYRIKSKVVGGVLKYMILILMVLPNCSSQKLYHITWPLAIYASLFHNILLNRVLSKFLLFLISEKLPYSSVIRHFFMCEHYLHFLSCELSIKPLPCFPLFKKKILCICNIKFKDSNSKPWQNNFPS